MMRRVLVFMVTLSVVAMTATAGGAKESAAKAAAIEVNRDGLPLVASPVTLTATAIQLPTGRALGDMPLFQDVERKTGVRIEWQMIPQSGRVERINLILASQDYPDFFWHSIDSIDLPQTLAERGAVIALDPYMEYAPNLQKLLDYSPEFVPYLRNPDGNIYSFPMYRQRIDLGSAGDRPYINYEWLDRLGLDVPETPDEFYEVLKAFKTGDPNQTGRDDVIPMSLLAGADNDISGWIALFGPWGVVYPQMVVDGKVVLGHMQPGFRDGLKFFNRLYEEGLLDPESFTQGREQLRAKATVNGVHMVGFFRDYVSWLVVDRMVSMYYMDFTDPTPNPGVVYDILPPLRGRSGTAMWPRATATPNFTPATGFVSTRARNPELAVRWLDLWMDGEHWGYSAEEGLEGLTWQVNNEGFVEPLSPPDGVSRNDWRNQNAYDIGSHWWSNELLPQVPQYGWITQAEMVDKLRPYFDDNRRFPNEYFSLPDEEAIINRYWPGILLYINENMARFITGDLDIDRNWDQYIAGFRALGAEQVLGAFQARYERFVAAGGR
ncbi:MAG: extracellular solute-binding protein [Spirochaetaceae bacterium]|nr:MAG: extracellular solute-binding protein [Spirochaetaceae bacterium]